MLSSRKLGQQKDAQRETVLTCAECKRLRLKCDKNIPCRNCVVRPCHQPSTRDNKHVPKRRRCENLCPHGTKITADGTRTVLAATKVLHDTVKDLRERIRLLETALNDIHLDRTGHTHPMISSAKVDLETEENLADQEGSEGKHNPMHTLAFVRGRDGAHRTAAANDRVWASHSVGDYPSSQAAALAFMAYEKEHYPGVQTRRIITGPSLPVPHSTIVGLQEKLPTTSVMEALLTVFHQSFGSTGFAPAFSEQYIRNTVIPNAQLHSGGHMTAVALATLFSVLSIGSLFAIDGEEAPEVAHYANMSLAALAASGGMMSPSIEMIEAFYLRAVLEFLRQGLWEELARICLAQAAHMCLSLGLHRDGAAFLLRPEILRRRRLVFWMVYTADVCESLAIGRPAVFSCGPNFIDTKYPEMDSNEALSAELPRNHASVAHVVASIANITLVLKPPSYKEILDIDAQVRKLTSPDRAAFTTAAFPLPLILLIYLHRAFYARALTQHTNQLSQSEYYYSVHATLRGAREALSWARFIVHRSPAMCARIWWIWSIAVAATVSCWKSLRFSGSE